jgi:hypothetical protein
MKLPEPLEKLEKIRHAKIIGVVAAIILNLALLIVAMNIEPNAGYYLMMVGLVSVTFAVPYLFGWRDGRMLLAMGVGMFLLVGAINGPLVVHDAYSSEPGDPVSSDIHVNWFTTAYEELDNNTYEAGGKAFLLADGKVDRFKGEPGTQYRFSIILYSNESFAETPNLQLGFARGIWGIEGTPAMTESDPSDQDYLDGKLFHHNITIEKAGIYSYWFALVFGTGTERNSVNTTVALGPLVGSETDNWSSYIPLGAASMFCNIGLLFLIIVLLYWWLSVAKEKRKTWDIALKEKEEEAAAEVPAKMDDALEEKKPFTCDQCGAGVGVDDNFCPKCGERFDGEDGSAEKSAEREGGK